MKKSELMDKWGFDSIQEFACCLDELSMIKFKHTKQIYYTHEGVKALQKMTEEELRTLWNLLQYDTEDKL